MTANEKYKKRQEVNQMLLLAHETAGELPQDQAAIVMDIASEMAQLALKTLDLFIIKCDCGAEEETDMELAMDYCIKCAMDIACKGCGKKYTEPHEVLFLSQDRICMNCDAKKVRVQQA